MINTKPIGKCKSWQFHEGKCFEFQKPKGKQLEDLRKLLQLNYNLQQLTKCSLADGYSVNHNKKDLSWKLLSEQSCSHRGKDLVSSVLKMIWKG